MFFDTFPESVSFPFQRLHLLHGINVVFALLTYSKETTNRGTNIALEIQQGFLINKFQKPLAELAYVLTCLAFNLFHIQLTIFLQHSSNQLLGIVTSL